MLQRMYGRLEVSAIAIDILSGLTNTSSVTLSIDVNLVFVTFFLKPACSRSLSLMV